jgi:[ribosomal protein S5]-alanine N-acetyltransferase
MLAELTTKRFILRSIHPEIDNFENYLKWMRDEASNPYIQSVNYNMTIEELCEYVSRKNESNDALLFGIFLSDTFKHIGNIKLEPIQPQEEAILGILIGEQEWRGKGVGFEVISRVIEYSFDELKLNRIKLGVDLSNLAAVKLYEKLGFEPEKKDQANSEIMMSLKKC